jgi:hypothetical protein
VVSVLKDVLAFYSIFPRSSPTKNDSKHTKRKKTQNKTEITEMTDTARPPPMSEIPPPVSASAALKMNSGGGGGGPDDVVAVAALIDELKVRFDYSLIGFFFFPMMVLVF